MSVTFELIVPNDDEGHSLGMVTFDALPRKGDSIVVWSKELMGKSKDPFIATVEAVIYEVFFDDPKASVPPEGDIKVYLTEEHAVPTIYCVCTKEKRERQAITAVEEDKDGLCFNCGKVRP